jgi:hypothetical protein
MLVWSFKIFELFKDVANLVRCDEKTALNVGRDNVVGIATLRAERAQDVILRVEIFRAHPPSCTVQLIPSVSWG